MRADGKGREKALLRQRVFLWEILHCFYLKPSRQVIAVTEQPGGRFLSLSGLNFALGWSSRGHLFFSGQCIVRVSVAGGRPYTHLQKLQV